jgi:Tol biopolymer transport system component
MNALRPRRTFATLWFAGLMVLIAATIAATIPSAAAQTGEPLELRIVGGLRDQSRSPDSVPPPWELWTIHVDGTGLKPFMTSTDGHRFGSPDWSPDGKWIAYDTWPNGLGFDASQVAVARADGSEARIIGPGAMPSWSPDGTHLVCHTYDSPQMIVVMKADGTGRETIINHWGSPRWSPRGNCIVSADPRGRLLKFDLATGFEREIVRPPSFIARQGFGISPDGLRICFGGVGQGVSILTLDRSTNHTVSVIRRVNSGTCLHASWSPDGKQIVFGWEPGANQIQQLYLLDADSGDGPRLLAGQNENRNNVNPDWSPDGKTIIFASQDPPRKGL